GPSSQGGERRRACAGAGVCSGGGATGAGAGGASATTVGSGAWGGGGGSSAGSCSAGSSSSRTGSSTGSGRGLATGTGGGAGLAMRSGALGRGFTAGRHNPRARTRSTSSPAMERARRKRREEPSAGSGRLGGGAAGPSGSASRGSYCRSGMGLSSRGTALPSWYQESLPVLSIDENFLEQRLPRPAQARLPRAPFEEADLQQLTVGMVDRQLEALAAMPRRPADRERGDPLLGRGEPQASPDLGDELRRGPHQQEQELVAAHAHHRVLRAGVLLEKTADLDQHLVAGLVAEAVVEFLEVIDVDDDGAPGVEGGQPLLHLRQEAPVVAAGEGIAQALLVEAPLDLLAAGKVDQDAVEEHLAGLGIPHGLATVENGALAAVLAADHAFELARRSSAGEPIQLRGALRRIGEEVVHAAAPQILQGRDAEDLQTGEIGVEDLTLRVGDVQPVPHPLDELAEGLRVLQAGNTLPQHRRLFATGGRPISLIEKSESDCYRVKPSCRGVPFPQSPSRSS